MSTDETIPVMCAWCKRWKRRGRYVRDDAAYMAYLRHDVRVSHGICPECYEKAKPKEENNGRRRG